MTGPAAPLTVSEIRGRGFEPTRRGWVPLSAEVDERMAQAVRDRIVPRPPAPRAIPGPEQPCVACGEMAEPSLVGTPTCSAICTAEVADAVLPLIAESLYTRGDGTGGTPQAEFPRAPAPASSPERRRGARSGSLSVEGALERLGTCSDVLERHGKRTRGRMAFCPFHENSRTPAMSLHERAGKSRAHCFNCDWSGDALDLEAALEGDDLKTTIGRWS